MIKFIYYQIKISKNRGGGGTPSIYQESEKK